jgi:hypothetical protein
MVDIDSLKMPLESPYKKMTSAVQKKSNLINILPGSQKISAVNLIQYLALRTEDIKSLKDELHIVGLPSLTCSESHIFRHKGNYIINIMNTLKDILRRSGGNHERKDILSDPCKLHQTI